MKSKFLFKIAFGILLMMPLLDSCGSGKSGETAESASAGTCYVCASGNAKVYHVRRSCRGLSNCRHEIEELTIDEAEEMGRRPCHICAHQPCNQ